MRSVRVFSLVRLMQTLATLAVSKSENSSMRVKFRCRPSSVKMPKVVRPESAQGRLTRSKRTVREPLHGNKKQNHHPLQLLTRSSLNQPPTRSFPHRLSIPNRHNRQLIYSHRLHFQAKHPQHLKHLQPSLKSNQNRP